MYDIRSQRDLHSNEYLQGYKCKIHLLIENANTNTKLNTTNMQYNNKTINSITKQLIKLQNN